MHKYMVYKEKECNKERRIIKHIIIFSAIVIISALIIFYLSKAVILINKHGFENILSLYEKKAQIIYFLVCFLQPIILPLPEPITIMGGSTVLGASTGASIGFMGTFLGIVFMFFISKYAGKAIVSKFINEAKLEKFNRYIQKNEMLIILMLFILPILPDEVICVGAGLAGINAYKFIGVAAISKMITSISLSYSLKIVKFDGKFFIICIILILVIAVFKKLNLLKK